MTSYREVSLTGVNYIGIYADHRSSTVTNPSSPHDNQTPAAASQSNNSYTQGTNSNGGSGVMASATAGNGGVSLASQRKKSEPFQGMISGHKTSINNATATPVNPNVRGH